ncbi:hypothetical protein C8Q80DRAFT_1166552 [Daedaleopsis nitida]|nr:hypothetical protein C8Q80DRAFT_1166552 [Daedaleopsis nitida]
MLYFPCRFVRKAATECGGWKEQWVYTQAPCSGVLNCCCGTMVTTCSGVLAASSAEFV